MENTESEKDIPSPRIFGLDRMVALLSLVVALIGLPMTILALIYADPEVLETLAIGSHALIDFLLWVAAILCIGPSVYFWTQSRELTDLLSEERNQSKEARDTANNERMELEVQIAQLKRQYEEHRASSEAQAESNSVTAETDSTAHGDTARKIRDILFSIYTEYTDTLRRMDVASDKSAQEERRIRFREASQSEVYKATGLVAAHLKGFVVRDLNRRGIDRDPFVSILLLETGKKSQRQLMGANRSDMWRYQVKAVAHDVQTADARSHAEMDSGRTIPEATKIGESTALKMVLTHGRNFVENDISSYNERHVKTDDADGNSVLDEESEGQYQGIDSLFEEVLGINSIITAPIFFRDKGNNNKIRLPFGFIAVYAKNDTAEELFIDNRRASIYNELSFCADVLAPLCLFVQNANEVVGDAAQNNSTAD